MSASQRRALELHDENSSLSLDELTKLSEKLFSEGFGAPRDSSKRVGIQTLKKWLSPQNDLNI